MQPLLAEIIAVERNIDQTNFAGKAKQLSQAPGNPGAATVNPDQHGIRLKLGAYKFCQLGALHFGIGKRGKCHVEWSIES